MCGGTSLSYTSYWTVHSSNRDRDDFAYYIQCIFADLPPFKRGKIMGIVGFVIMFAPTIGPTLSGVIVEYLGWRSLFIMVIPFSIFSIAFASKFLINVSEVTKPKIDYLSLVFQL